MEHVQSLPDLFKKDANRVQALKRAAPSALRVFDVLRERPINTLDVVCRRTGLTFPTASKGIAALVALGIVRELTDQRRNHVFVYDRYLDILNASAEPL